jgi:stress response protein YsnF
MILYLRGALHVGPRIDDQMQDDDSKIALAKERIVVSKHLQAAEVLRVHTVVHTDEQVVATPVTRERFEVTRVPLDCWVEAPIPERQEGDTRIVTLHAEVVVTETRLKAIEEVRITRRRDTRETIERVTVRREEAVLERIPAPAPGAAKKS